MHEAANQIRPYDSGPARRSRSGLALAAAFFLLWAGFATLAPGGRWPNRIFGFAMWKDNDPGGFYLASAHELFSNRGHMIFVGHPGLPLQILLSLTQYVLFAVGGGPGSGLSFTDFTARHLATIWLLARLLTTAVHLLSFVCLYRLARSILASERAAAIAVAAYATSLPVLYYVSRVSVEPWMVALFCLTFLALAAHEEASRAGLRRRALLSAALAALAAVSAFFSKIHLMGLLPLFCIGPLLGLGESANDRARETKRLRLEAVILFVAVGAVAALLFSALMDWRGFFGQWSAIVGEQADLVRSQFSPAQYLPRLSREGLFLLCEIPFLTIAGAGLVRLVRDRPAFARLRWPALYALLTVLVWVPRSVGVGWGSFNYLFVAMAVLSLPFGLAADCALSRLGATPRGRCQRPIAVALSILLVHGLALWAAIDSRIRDVRQYRALHGAALYRALSDLPAGERLLVVGSFTDRFHGLNDSYSSPGRVSSLERAIDDRIVALADLPGEERTEAGFERRRISRVLDLRDTLEPQFSLREWRALGGRSRPAARP